MAVILGLFFVFIFGLPAIGLFVAFRAPKKHWVVRDWYAGMKADQDWQNPGYDGDGIFEDLKKLLDSYLPARLP